MVNIFAMHMKAKSNTPHSASYLHVAWWNLLPFRKHLLGDSLHSQEHFVLLRGWCLGHVLLHTHWQVSLLKTWFRGQEGAGRVLQMHWQVFRSRCRLGPQSWGGTLRWHTHWQVPTSSSLSGPHTSAENMSEGIQWDTLMKFDWNSWRDGVYCSIDVLLFSLNFLHFLRFPVC